MFGLVCIALAWPRLRRQSWWWRLDNLAGRCQWEWWRWQWVNRKIGLLVSRPEGRVSCRPVQARCLRLSQRIYTGRLQSAPNCSRRNCNRRRSISQLQAAAAGLLVAILDVMMWCLLGPALRLCFSICGGCSLLRCRRDVMSRRAQWRWRWRSVGDQAGAACAAESGRSRCRCWGAGLVLLGLGGHSTVCSGLCQW